jgi:uncharacterized protein YciI
MKLLKSIFCILFLLVIGELSFGQQKVPNTQISPLGQYWFVMYSKGTNYGQDSTTKIKLDQEHIYYIISLRKAGKIITGGAFTDKTAWIGFEIYNCKTKEEVIKITEADPIVSSKIFSYEINSWMTLKGEVKFE